MQGCVQAYTQIRSRANEINNNIIDGLRFCFLFFLTVIIFAILKTLAS